MYVLPLAAQEQPPQTVNAPTSTLDPTSARITDSLFKLNNVRKFGDRIRPSVFQRAQQPKSTVHHDPLPSAKSSSRQIASSQRALQRTSETVCYGTSGRDFLYQDSLYLYAGDPTTTADGNVIVSGGYADYAQSPVKAGGFCMKTDIKGNVIWAKLFDSTNNKGNHYIDYFRSTELKSGAIVLAGRSTNNSTYNNDFILTKLDKNGNLLWTKTYGSRFWQGFTVSGDYFDLKDLEEDSYTGEIYFVGNHWYSNSTVTKVDPGDGHIIWSRSYDTGISSYPFGIVIYNSNLLLFQLGNSFNSNQGYISAIAINKMSGDTLYSKHIQETGNHSFPRLFNAFEVTPLYNGNYLLTGPTTGHSEYPEFTGTVDLFHAAIIELDASLNFVKAYGIKNRLQSNKYNTKLNCFTDGTCVFSMLEYVSTYSGNVHVYIFNDAQIYHQRKRLHRNEGIPYEPYMRRLPDGGFLNVKLLDDSISTNGIGSRIDYTRLQTFDTASLCLGIPDSSASFWYSDYRTTTLRFDSVRRNVFSETRAKTYTVSDFTAWRKPACEVVSNCDSLAISASATTVCPGSSITITIKKNQGCGSLVPLRYDTNWVSMVSRINDTTYNFRFDKTGTGYITGSLLGCVMQKDSVFIQVLQAPAFLNLGPDKSICPANSIVINAGKGYASYFWQDGSQDSTYTATQPGLYHVVTTDACGMVFKDSVYISAAPAIPFDAGTDRIKCNNDTLKLTAPPGFLNYTWSNNYNISSLTSATVVINPLLDTAYYVKAEKTPGCFAYDTVRVRVYRSPVVNLGRDTSFCSGNFMVLDAGDGFNSYLWSNGQRSRTVTVNAAGIYSVAAATTQGCRSSDTMKVSAVFTLPVIRLNKETGICAGSSKVLDAGRFASYRWSTGATTQTVSVNNVGVYSVSVTDINGCTNGDTTTITTIHPLPAKFLPADTAVCSYGTLDIKSLSPFATYAWNDNSRSPRLVVSKAGLYWLRVTDANNCSGTDSINVVPKQCLDGLYVPNGFTPNNDGKNDLFKPLLFGDIKKYEFRIFNRFGQAVFGTNDSTNGWNGLFKGKEQSAGVFVWYCFFQLEGGPEQKRKGTVVLIR